MIRIFADEALFDRWNNISNKIQLGRSIVQNGMLISESQLGEWVSHQEDLSHELALLREDTIRYVKGGVPR